MKRPTLRQDRHFAFTLVELMVSTSVVTIAGGSIFLAVNAGLNLFAKNTSLNVAHQQLVKAVQRITRDAHACIATPKLLDIDGAGNITVNNGTGPAAGVSFEVLWQRPFKMTAGGAGGTSKITIDTASTATPPGPRPVPGQRAYLPGNDNTEENITIVAANATPAYSDITLQNTLWKTIAPNAAGYDRPVIIADKIAYVVTGGSMHFYSQTYSGGTFSWLDRGTRVRNVTSPTPFSLTNSRTVTGNLTVSDPTYSNRGYKALGMPVTFQAPYRTKLSIY
jgi:type II secretory pathway pseudopilin PulG